MTRKLRRKTATNERVQWMITAGVAVVMGVGIAFAAQDHSQTRPVTPSHKDSLVPKPAPKPAADPRMKTDLYGYLLDLDQKDPAQFKKTVKGILAAPKTPQQDLTALRAWTEFGSSNPLPALCRAVRDDATPKSVKTWAHDKIEERCKADPSLRPKVAKLLGGKSSM